MGKLLFQFHKGTIRTLVFVYPTFRPALFQFHKGTIRTAEEETIKAKGAIFQFHKGTIRTSYAVIFDDSVYISIP